MNTGVSATLFSTVQFPISFSSPFTDAAEFTVQLFEGTPVKSQSPHSSPKQRTKGKKRKSLQSTAPVAISHLQNRSEDTMNVFHCHQQTITLPSSDQQASLQLEVTPLKMAPRQCYALLSNEKLGDIVVTASLSTSLPSPSTPLSTKLHSSTFIDKERKALHLKVLTGERVREEIIVESSNPLLEEAAMRLSQWGMDGVEQRRRVFTHSLKYASLQTAMKALQLDDTPKTHWDRLPPGADHIHFQVSGSSSLFSFPAELSVPGGKGGRSILPFQFFSEDEGHYRCEVVLTSRHEVRVLNVEVTVTARGRHALLELHTPALQPLTQDIPLVRENVHLIIVQKI